MFNLVKNTENTPVFKFTASLRIPKSEFSSHAPAFGSDIHSFAMSDIALTGSDIHSFGMSDIFSFRKMFRKPDGFSVYALCASHIVNYYKVALRFCRGRRLGVPLQYNKKLHKTPQGYSKVTYSPNSEIRNPNLLRIVLRTLPLRDAEGRRSKAPPGEDEALRMS